MGDGTKENPYTREDVLQAIEGNGGTARGLDLIGRWFENGIDLSELDLKRAWLGVAHLEGANFRDTHLEGADLTAAHLEGADFRLSHLEGANLRFAHLEGVILAGVEVPRDTKLDSVHWGNYVLGEERREEEKRVWCTLAADTYRRLKVWHTQSGYHDTAAKFYYREREASRKALKWCSMSSFRHRLALQASYLVFGHGEDWKRLLFGTMPILVLGFAVVYWLIGTLMPNTFLHSLYYSAVSFTALGYGNWAPEPTGWVKGLGAFEAFVGVFMMALLLVTFVRKWTR